MLVVDRRRIKVQNKRVDVCCDGGRELRMMHRTKGQRESAGLEDRTVRKPGPAWN